MMVQNAPDGAPHFISTMAEHNDLCGQFVRAFGNERFQRPEPYDELVYVVSHHDRGWDAWDEDPDLDPRTGLPCGLGGTPAPVAIGTITKSPDYNERRHAFCGLLSSMHSWGLYNARYGYSEFRVRPGGSTSVPVNDAYAAETRAALEAELDRQARLKAVLAAHPESRDWVEEKRLVQCYKLLQFFDTLALYFNIRHESERGEEVFVHVPADADEDVSVTITPRGGGVYGMSPFPFAGDRLEAACAGRWLAPVGAGEAPPKLGAVLHALPTESQRHVLIAA